MAAISVVLPVFNARATVADAIASLDADLLSVDDGDAIEVLAIDDGSTDGSGAVLDALAAAQPWLRVLHRPHGGIVDALNAGLAAARGSYIARMDADDTSLPGRLARQREFLDSHPDIGLVSGRVEFGGDRARARGYALHVDWLNSLTTPEAIALARFIESPFAHPSVMFRRELLAVHGGYRDSDFPEDYELWLRWMDAGVRMARIDVPVLLWNDPPARLSRCDPRYSVDAFYSVKARYLARWLARENPLHPHVIVWGAGRITRKRVRLLQHEGVEVHAWVDIDPDKIGQRIDGVRVLSPGQLFPHGSRFILTYVGNRNARADIAHWLDTHGYRHGIDYLHAA